MAPGGSRAKPGRSARQRLASSPVPRTGRGQAPPPPRIIPPITWRGVTHVHWSISRLLSAPARQRLLFLVLCFVWGTTWLAMKVGISVVPPAFFSGVRWTVAGLVLLGWRHYRHEPVRTSPRLLARLAVLSLFMVSVSAAIQLYGLRLISSGMAGVINSGLTPIFLLVFAAATHQERAGWRQVIAIVIGIVGLLLLFGPQAMVGQLEWREALGILLLVIATICTCFGNVLSRPLMRTIPPVQLAGLTNLIGGLVLLVLALPLEPGAWQAARLDWGWPAWIGWCWLVFAGSTGASIIFFMLLRDWGASRAGSYSFVSPVVAVFLGMGFMGEQVNAMEALGMTLMLVGAALGNSGRRQKGLTAEAAAATVAP